MGIETKNDCQLAWASWTAIDRGMVSLSCNWAKAKMPQFKMGNEKNPVRKVERADPLWYGLHSGYYTVGTKIRFVLRTDHVKHIDLEENSFYLAGSFNGWADAIGDDAWKLSLRRIEKESVLVLELPFSLFANHTFHQFKFVTGKGEWIDVSPDAPNAQLDDSGSRNYLLNINRTGYHIFVFKTPAKLNEVDSYDLHFDDGKDAKSVRMHPGVFLKQLSTDQELGVIIDRGMTEFRLFAPRASSVNLYLYDSLENEASEPINLECDVDFVWKASVHGDRHGWYYYYKIEGEELHGSSYFDRDFKVLDPYAKAAVGPIGPGIILRDDFYEPNRPRPFKAPAWHDLVIAEAHVRDLNAYAPVEMSDDERLGFEGLTKWVQDEHFYLKELGVNAIELQPLQLFDAKTREEYAWGYMPVNYFSPASQYSLQPEKASMVHETQRLVDSLHDAGFAVILDVVYNHVGDPNFLQFIDKEYYFLINADGYYENHSGCGNTLDADTPMLRRLIRDSLVHWMNEYGIDGFRFDLGELIGKEALVWIEAEVKAIKPEVILVVEPWSFRAHIAPDLVDTGIASWNDGYRETIKDYLLGEKSADHLNYFVQGSTPNLARFPAQTFNYLESHDDRCWIDKITENKDFDGSHPTELDRRRTHLMVGILMISVGVPMLSAGMDFLKSKQGVNNTYLRGDLNALPYGRGMVYSNSVQYFKDWIRFRLSELGKLVRLDGFPLEGYFETFYQDSAYGLLINANGGKGTQKLFFAVNPSPMESIMYVSSVNWDKALLVADAERMDLEGLNFPNYYCHNKRLHLPGYCLGLWVC